MKPGLVGFFGSLPPRWRLFVAIVAVIVVADQVSKYMAVGSLTRAFEASVGEDELGFGDRLSRFLWSKHPMRSEAVAVIDDFWHFRYAENPGAAFSFLSNQPSWFRTPFFLLISLAAMAFIALYFRRTTPGQGLLRLSLSMVFGGALGNFVDRVRLGYVIDFIDWHWYDKATWPTFNVADSAITVGISVMVLEVFFRKAPSAADKKTAKA